MKRFDFIFAVLTAALAFPAMAADVDNNPPGPAGGAGSNWENRPGPQGGPGASPDRQRPQLTPEQREKLKAMTPEQRKQFMEKMRERRADNLDRDGNPPGPAGGAGTNWENRPGPKGGPGASPDRQRPQLTPEQREKLKAMTPEQRKQFMESMRERRADRMDRDGNPPGPAGGAGTNWENRPGPKGGPGASPDRQRPQLTPEQMEKLKAMTPEERRAFMNEKRENRPEAPVRP